MHDHERHVVLLFVSAVPFAPHLMMAAEFTVIRIEDNNRVFIHAVVLERLEHLQYLLITVADAIVVIVSKHMPPAILVGPLADHHILDRLIDRMGLGAAG